MPPDVDDLARQADPIRGRVIPTLPASLAEDITQGRRRATSRSSRPVTRRLLVLVAAALTILGTVAATVYVLNEPERLAANSVGCYEDATLAGGVTITWAGHRDPVEVCAEVYRREGRPVPALVACAYHGAVAVIPGRDRAACDGGGLEQLPVDYTTARKKVAKLERDVMALERDSGCLPPREFERRVQALLAASGWTGWTTWLRLDISGGACGTVSGKGGDGVRSLSGAIDQEHHRLMIFAEPPRAAQDKLDRLVPLYDETGARCWSLAELKARVRREAADLGLSVAVEVYDAPGAVMVREDGTRERVTEGIGIGDARGGRWRAGCAILAGITLQGDGRGISVELDQKGAEGK